VLGGTDVRLAVSCRSTGVSNGSAVDGKLVVSLAVDGLEVGVCHRTISEDGAL